MIIKLLLILTLSLIFFQDIKEQMVWFFLLPSFAILGSLLYFKQSSIIAFLTGILINLSIVGILMGIIFFISKFLFQKKLLNESLGLGDLLFFIAFALSFPPISFLHFFVFSLLFSLVTQQFIVVFLKRKGKISQKNTRVPLAGLMAFFLMYVYTAHWLGFYSTLYFVL